MANFLSKIFNTVPSGPAYQGFTSYNRMLPNGAGSYNAPIVPQSFNPELARQNLGPVTPPAGTIPPPQKKDIPIKTGGGGSIFNQPGGNNNPPPAVDNSNVINPKTGKLYTPTEYREMMAAKARATGGGVQSYANSQIASPNQTLDQLTEQGFILNNARNDIATGATDPYGAASKSGMQYTAAELSAIEKAYAGVYDPALTDVFGKIENKKKEAEDATKLEQELKKMAMQHQYDVALKKTPTASESASSSGFGGAATEYVRGENAIVDGWVDRLNQSGEAINVAIPGVKNQGLRDAVMLGLNASKAKNAKMSGTMDDINTMSTMLANPKLENISGFLDQAIGGMFGKAKTAKTQYNQILGALQLAKAGQIKGQGQISDYERKVLKEAAAAVDRGMNDEEFRKAIVKLRGVLQTSSGMSAKVLVTDPTTGQSDSQNLTTEEINGFISDGAIIEYLE